MSSIFSEMFFTKIFFFVICNSLFGKTYGRWLYMENIFIGCIFTLGENIVQSTLTRKFKNNSIELCPICGNCGGISCSSSSYGRCCGITQILHVPLPKRWASTGFLIMSLHCTEHCTFKCAAFAEMECEALDLNIALNGSKSNAIFFELWLVFIHKNSDFMNDYVLIIHMTRQCLFCILYYTWEIIVYYSGSLGIWGSFLSFSPN